MNWPRLAMWNSSSRFKFTPRLNANYIDNDGSKQYPVMIHRAFFGSWRDL